MPKENGGCITFLLKAFLVMAVVVYGCMLLDSFFGKDKTDDALNNDTGSIGSEYIQNDDLAQNDGTDGWDTPDSYIQPYRISQSGYVVENILSPYTFALSDIHNLDGFFSLDAAGSKLLRLPACDGTFSETYNDTGLYLFAASSLPICVDRANGDQLVVTGNEWSDRSEDERRSMTVRIYSASLIGYGDTYAFESIDVSELDTVNGVSISAINKDYVQVTNALKGTGISCIFRNAPMVTGWLLHKRFLISAEYGASMDCGYYRGTQYQTISTSMVDPFVAVDTDSALRLPVQATTNGYFTIDISSLYPGMYILRGVRTMRLLVIE